MVKLSMQSIDETSHPAQVPTRTNGAQPPNGHNNGRAEFNRTQAKQNGHAGGNKPPKPEVLKVLLDQIPDELTHLDQWVLSRLTWKPTKKKWDKPPMNFGGALASSTDKKTWDSFGAISSAYNAGKYDCIGFVLTTASGIVAIDLDGCREPETGEIEPEAQGIIDRSGSYAEVSPSGNGIRIFLRGAMPANGRKVAAPWKRGDEKAEIEAASNAKYMTVTGHHIEGTPREIVTNQTAIDWLFSKYFEKEQLKPTATPLPLGLDDNAILEKAMNAKNSAKFMALWNGDISEYPSPSEAEMAFCCILAFYTSDAAQMDRLWLASNMQRGKTERADYRARTIKNALEIVTQKYDPTPRHLQRLVKTAVQEKESNADAAAEFPAVRAGEQLPALEREFILTCLDEEEDGDAKLFARLYDNRLIFDHAQKCWNEWRGHSWAESKTGIERRLITGQVAWQYLNEAATLTREAKADLDPDAAARKFKQADLLMDRARKLRKLNRIKNVLELAAGHMGTDGEQWDQKPHLVGVQNGVIDLRLRTFRPGQPDDFIRTISPTKWKGFNEPAPRFEKFILEIQDGAEDVAALIRRAFGVGLWGEVKEHFLPIMWGPKGRNGKDTLLEAISFVLGPMAGAVSVNILLTAKNQHSEGPTPFLFDLRGKRIVWASETNEGAQLNAGQVKYITGGGEITARPCRGNAVHFKPTHTAFLLTNEKPRAKSDDNALWSRLILIPFDLRFVADPKEANERLHDLSLKDKLKEEASGILAWLVRGFFEWQEAGLNPPESVRLATEQYQQDEDTVATFLAECCSTADTEAKIGATELFKAYGEFTGRTAVSQKVFGQKVVERFQKVTSRGRKFYKGITLTDSTPTLNSGDSGDSGDRESKDSTRKKNNIENNRDGDSPLSPLSPLEADEGVF